MLPKLWKQIVSSSYLWIDMMLKSEKQIVQQSCLGKTKKEKKKKKGTIILLFLPLYVWIVLLVSSTEIIFLRSI